MVVPKNSPLHPFGKASLDTKNTFDGKTNKKRFDKITVTDNAMVL